MKKNIIENSKKSVEGVNIKKELFLTVTEEQIKNKWNKKTKF